MDSPKISTLPLDELLEMYEHASLVMAAIQREPYAWHELAPEHIKLDMNMLYAAMQNKIPMTHDFEIYQLEKDMHTRAERQQLILETFKRRKRKKIILNATLTIAIIAVVVFMIYIGDDIDKSIQQLLRNLWK